MPLFTNTYKFGYFYNRSDQYSGAVERQRWLTADVNLGSIATLLGNGVIENWDVSGQIGGDTISISSGAGFVNGLSSKTTTTISLDVPAVANKTYKVLAHGNSETYYSEFTTFVLQDSLVDTPSDSILIALITTDAQGLLKEEPDNSVKHMMGVSEDLLTALQNHVHSGEAGMPTKIDLSSEVTGILDSSHLPDIPATKIIGGIPAERLGNISHKLLLDIGANTHVQIDEFIKTINKSTFQHLGLITAINAAESIITQTHLVGDEALRYIANTRVIIPGVTPDSWNDESPGPDRATINKPDHQIEGEEGVPLIPPEDRVTPINKYEGPDGFIGPRQIEVENLDIAKGNADDAIITLKKLYVYEYYFDEGILFVDFDSSGVSDWQTLSWSKDLYGGGKVQGTYGEDDLDMKVYAQSALRRSSLPSSPDPDDWVYLGDYTVNTASLLDVPDNQWIRFMFVFHSNTDNEDEKIAKRVTPVLTALKLDYNRNSDPECRFILLHDKTDWDSNKFSITGIDILDGSEGIILSGGQGDVASSSVFESPVLYLDNFAGWKDLYLAYKTPAGTDVTIDYKSSDSSFTPNDTTLPWKSLDSITSRISIRNINKKYLQFRLSFWTTQNTFPEIAGIGVSVFDEIKAPSNIPVTYVEVDDTLHKATVALDEEHGLAPNDFVLIEDLPSPADGLNGIYKLLEGSFGKTLVYTSMLTSFSPVTPTQGKSRVLAESTKTWNSTGTDKGGWREANPDSRLANNMSSNLTDTNVMGAMSLKSGSYGEWVSGAYNTQDPDFKKWSRVEIHGEDMFTLEAYVEWCDSLSGSWVGGDQKYTSSSSPLIIDLSDNQYSTKPWIRIRLRISTTAAVIS